MIWAKNGLPYQLVDEPMYKQFFGTLYPTGLNRKTLSVEMQKLALKIDLAVASKLRGRGPQVRLCTRRKGVCVPANPRK